MAWLCWEANWRWHDDDNATASPHPWRQCRQTTTSRIIHDHGVCNGWVRYKRIRVSPLSLLLESTMYARTTGSYSPRSLWKDSAQGRWIKDKSPFLCSCRPTEVIWSNCFKGAKERIRMWERLFRSLHFWRSRLRCGWIYTSIVDL